MLCLMHSLPKQKCRMHTIPKKLTYHTISNTFSMHPNTKVYKYSVNLQCIPCQKLNLQSLHIPTKQNVFPTKNVECISYKKFLNQLNVPTKYFAWLNRRVNVLLNLLSKSSIKFFVRCRRVASWNFFVQDLKLEISKPSWKWNCVSIGQQQQQ